MDPSIDELPPPHLVETQEALERLLDVIDGEDVIAVDTEADSFYSYRDKVCLFQVTAGGEDYLVDPPTKAESLTAYIWGTIFLTIGIALAIGIIWALLSH